MKIMRVRNPVGVNAMEEFILPDEDIDRSRFIEVVKVDLTDNPNDIFLVQAWDSNEGKDPELKGFVIAYAPVGYDHVFVYQIWVEPEANEAEQLSDKLFYRLVLWAHELGRTELRAETHRKTEPFRKRWNFKVHSYVMAYEIPEDFEISLVKNHNALVKGADDGIKRGIVERESPHRVAKESPEEIEGLPATADR